MCTGRRRVGVVGGASDHQVLVLGVLADLADAEPAEVPFERRAERGVACSPGFPSPTSAGMFVTGTSRRSVRSLGRLDRRAEGEVGGRRGAGREFQALDVEAAVSLEGTPLAAEAASPRALPLASSQAIRSWRSPRVAAEVGQGRAGAVARDRRGEDDVAFGIRFAALAVRQRADPVERVAGPRRGLDVDLVVPTGSTPVKSKVLTGGPDWLSL